VRQSFHKLYPIIALLLVAGATLWLERVTGSNESHSSAPVRSEPDFTADQVRMINFDKTGRQHFELLADRVIHHPQSSVTELQNPRLRYDVSGRELNITAQHADVLNEGNEVRMSGDVHARRAAIPGSPELTLASATLTVWPDDEKAQTNDPVTLTQGNSKAQADGMKADNLYGTLELIGNARMNIARSTRTTP
jgi:lipopolysaccharide export system protein LptC